MSQQQRMKPLPPEVQAELRRRLEAGEPLPPGVVPMQGRQGPGNMPGMPPGMGGMPGAQSPEDVKTQLNPIPHGEQGIAVVREQTGCPLGPEAQKLNDFIKQLLNYKTDDEAVHDAIDETISKGLGVGIRGHRHCDKQIKTRTMCYFSKDDKLGVFAEQISKIEEDMSELESKIKDIVERGNALIKERFEYIVKTYGLSLEKYFYWIDEDKGLVESVLLDCDRCKGITKMRKARQEAEALVKSLQKDPKEA